MALALLESGKLRVEPMVQIRNLRDWKQCFEDLESGKALKILLQPEE